MIDSILEFAVCIRNDGYPVALETRKLYQVLPDAQVAAHHYMRIVDESGEDYLYPEDYFMLMDLPPAIQEAVLRAA